MIVAPSANAHLAWGPSARPAVGTTPPGDPAPTGGPSERISALGNLLSQLGRLAVDEPDLFRRAAGAVASTLTGEARDQALSRGRATEDLAAGFARAADGGALPAGRAAPSGYGPAAAYAREQHALDHQRATSALEAALVQALPG